SFQCDISCPSYKNLGQATPHLTLGFLKEVMFISIRYLLIFLILACGVFNIANGRRPRRIRRVKRHCASFDIGGVKVRRCGWY
ncbi:unnamed protein product, partial [Cylicocyclus nassatus]